MIILWLDDAFDVSRRDEILKRSYGEFEGLLKQNRYEKSVELRKCANADDFNKAIKDNENQIVAAILDVVGYVNYDNITPGQLGQNAFIKAHDFCKDRNIPYVVYSGCICGEKDCANNETFWSMIDSDKKEGLCLGTFDKGDVDNPHHGQQIFNVLKSYIENFKWRGYEYILCLINKGFIEFRYANIKNELLGIIDSYKERSYLLGKLSTMRQVYYSILNHLFNREDPLFEILNKRYDQEISGNNEEIKYLTEYYQNGDYNNQYIPYEVCPKEIKLAISFVWNAVNNGSHFTLGWNNLFQGKEDIPNEQYGRAVYDSFFLVLRWYYIFMEEELYNHIPGPNPQNNATQQQNNNTNA